MGERVLAGAQGDSGEDLMGEEGWQNGNTASEEVARVGTEDPADGSLMEGVFPVDVTRLVRDEALGVRIGFHVGVKVCGEVKEGGCCVDGRDIGHDGLLSCVLCVLRVKDAGKLNGLDKRGVVTRREYGGGEG